MLIKQNKDINKNLAKNLKLARTEKGWSLDYCSKQTGVSKAMLGQIERGESSPTIAKLWQIASGFALPLSYFLTELVPESTTNKPLTAELASDHSINIVTKFKYDPMTKMETFQLSLLPDHQHVSEPHNEGVIEHILMISGTMEYFLADQWHELKAGESIKFAANQIHGYRNLQSEVAVFHNIICYIL